MKTFRQFIDENYEYRPRPTMCPHEGNPVMIAGFIAYVEAVLIPHVLDEVRTAKIPEQPNANADSAWQRFSMTVNGGPMSISHWGLIDLGRFGVVYFNDEPPQWHEGWDCPIGHDGCTKFCGSYGCGG